MSRGHIIVSYPGCVKMDPKVHGIKETFIMLMVSVGWEPEQSTEGNLISVPLGVRCGSSKTRDWKHLNALLIHVLTPGWKH